jgi:hypothetical protein
MSTTRHVTYLLIFLSCLLLAACGDSDHGSFSADAATDTDASDAADSSADSEPSCGNGVVELGEECDSGEHCSSQCRFVRCGTEERPCSAPSCDSSEACAAGCERPEACSATVATSGLPDDARLITLTDIDGDLDADILVRSADELCAYINESTATAIRFESNPSLCLQLPDITREDSERLDIIDAGVVPIYDPSAQTDVLINLNGGFVVEYRNGELIRESIGVIGDEACDAYHLAQFPANDPTVQVGYAACWGRAPVRVTLDSDGNVSVSDPPAEDPASVHYAPYGFSLTDLDEDGVPALLIVQDSFSIPGLRNTGRPSGGALGFVSPLDPWPTRLTRFTQDEDAWGSFMGTACLHTERFGLGCFLSDLGPNRFIVPNNQNSAFQDRAAELGVTFGYAGERLLSAWSATPIDWNGDGRQDLIVSQDWWEQLSEQYLGVVSPEVEDHEDVVMLAGKNSFDIVPIDYGSSVSRDNQTLPHLTLVPLDLNGDGRLEFIGLSANNRDFGVKVEVTTDRREHAPGFQTIWPRPRYAVTRGELYAYRTARSDDWMPLGTSVYLGATTPGSLTVPGEATAIRFPSGYIASIGEAEALVVREIVEPEWLSVRDSASGGLVVQVDAAEMNVDTVRARARDGDPISFSRVDDNVFESLGLVEGEEFLLELDGFWVRHWFSAN